jgi:hypothetical protein
MFVFGIALLIADVWLSRVANWTVIELSTCVILIRKWRQDANQTIAIVVFM